MTSQQPLLAVAGDRRLCGSVASVPFMRIHGHIGRAWARLTTAHRQRRILELIALLWLFGTVDLILTLWAQRFTLFHEMNPIARAMLDGGRTHAIVLFKFGLLATGSAAFWVARHRRCAEGALWALAMAYVLLMFRWSAYTANADELAHWRQVSDFTAAPMIGQRSATMHRPLAGRVVMQASVSRPS